MKLEFYIKQSTIHFLFSLISYPECLAPFFGRPSPPFISLLLASQPSICMPPSVLKDTCPINTLLKVIESLIAIQLLFRGHFLINAIDKVGAGHSMWRRKLFLPRNFLDPLLLPLLIPEHYKRPIALITLPSSDEQDPQNAFISLDVGQAI